MTNPRGLLETARKLVNSTTVGSGRPPMSDLRRATSTAYYALFHQLTRHGASLFFAGSSSSPDRVTLAHVARGYQHRALLRACGLVLAASSGHQPSKSDEVGVRLLQSSAGGMVPRTMVDLAEDFDTLQRFRHQADYDPLMSLSRATVKQLITRAASAVDSAGSMFSPSPERGCYHTFLRLALAYSDFPGKAR